ncbi:hypothetical protein [Bradyrhizobium sp. UFLA05-112]
MIAASAGVKIMIATRPVDLRNYAAAMIMRSRHEDGRFCSLLDDIGSA